MNDATLCFLVCHNFHAEVGAGVTAEGWSDVHARAFPTRCGRPPLHWDELRPLLPPDCTQVVVFGRTCLNSLDAPPADFPPVRVIPLEQCFHLVAGACLVDDAIANGGYLITPTWLADWHGQLAAMGFAPAQAGEFFHDFARELVLLDTGIDPAAPQHLAALGETVNLPVRRIAVGLDHVRQLLARQVLTWRLEQAHAESKAGSQRHTSELADHVAAMDILVRLAKTQHEEEAIAAIDNLFHMLFAPAALYYLRVENDIATSQVPLPEGLRATLLGLRTDHAWTPDGQGFLLRIGHAAATLGLLAVDRLAFPSYRQRYLNLALAVTGVCGLAIENARNRKRLLEAEKMASLGILVAGVAHEINTPLGVGLTAASTLQSQSRKLAEQFVAHSMTQTDLARYLDMAAASTELLQHNLERIGQLIDAFRQVAVDGQPLAKRLFKLKDCLDEVIRSLGDRLPAAHIAVRIDCDPTLEIESVAGDWASIFVNLLSNSLNHGFKGRAQGSIEIRIVRSAKWLRVDYHDDGIGLTPEAQIRIFDPFYSTDLQHGMGLGMHLVYNLITHRMGGSIQCENTSGQGATFHIEVPQ